MAWRQNSTRDDDRDVEGVDYIVIDMHMPEDASNEADRLRENRIPVHIFLWLRDKLMAGLELIYRKYNSCGILSQKTQNCAFLEMCSEKIDPACLPRGVCE